LQRPAHQRDARRKRLCLAALNGETVGGEQEVADRYTVALEVIRGLGSAEEITWPDLPFAAAAATIISAEAASAFEEILEAGAAAESTEALLAIDTIRALRIRRKAIGGTDSSLAPFDAAIAPGRSAVAPPLDLGFQEEPKDSRVRTIGRAANLCSLPDTEHTDGIRSVWTTDFGRVASDAAMLAVGIAYQD